MFLEDLIGIRALGTDAPDSLGWELKWYTDRTSLLTLFHKEPTGPARILRYMVRQYGKKDGQGRLSFRHTIRGKSDRFRVFEDQGELIVRPAKGNGPVPYWSKEELLNVVASKLRRLIMVNGERKGRKVRFRYADVFETFSLTDFLYEVMRGEIAIDFDAREAKPGSAGLRNHGTKFRVPPSGVCRLYMKKDRLR